MIEVFEPLTFLVRALLLIGVAALAADLARPLFWRFVDWLNGGAR